MAPGTEKDWQQPPFDGVIADGFIWGRGAWDDKGNLYSMLEAAEAMAKADFRPKRTIYLRSVMTKKPRAPPAPNRSRRCSPRAASASTSWSMRAC